VTTFAERTYQMRIVGHLDDHWSGWLEGFSIARCEDGTCTITGSVADQAQLHGILARLRDIGATLVSLRMIDGDDEERSASGHQTELAAAAHGRAPTVHAELGVDVLGVCAQGVEGDEQSLGDLGTVEFSGEQA
jgi:hypothetical protein